MILLLVLIDIRPRITNCHWWKAAEVNMAAPMICTVSYKRDSEHEVSVMPVQSRDRHFDGKKCQILGISVNLTLAFTFKFIIDIRNRILDL